MGMLYSLLERIDQLDAVMYLVAWSSMYVSMHFGRIAQYCITKLQEPGMLDDFEHLMTTSKLEDMRGKISRKIFVSIVATVIPVGCSFLKIPLEFTVVIYSVCFIIMVSCVAYNYTTYRNVAKFNGEVVYKISQKIAIERKLAKLRQAGRESEA